MVDTPRDLATYTDDTHPTGMQSYFVELSEEEGGSRPEVEDAGAGGREN